jgi:hypothetical protein
VVTITTPAQSHVSFAKLIAKWELHDYAVPPQSKVTPVLDSVIASYALSSVDEEVDFAVSSPCDESHFHTHVGKG